MHERWYKQAVIYCLDVETFQDSNGDGVGDLAGLIDRLDYLARLGVTCLWLNPIHPSPNRDDGYDVADFYGVDPRLGTLGDFAELIHQADNRGLRVIIDLVVNHTSDEHPWFQAARSDPDVAVPRLVRVVRGRAVRPPPGHGVPRRPGRRRGRATSRPAPGTTTASTTSSPTSTWPTPRCGPGGREDHRLLAAARRVRVPDGRRPVHHRADRARRRRARARTSTTSASFRELLSWRRGDAVILAEANAEPAGAASSTSATGDRLPMLFNFLLNQRTFLALARGEAAPILQALVETPAAPRRRASGPRSCATTTRSTSAGSASHERDEVLRRLRARAGDAALRAGHPPPAGARCSATTGGGSRWPTACSSPCRARRSSATARRSAWATTCR